MNMKEIEKRLEVKTIVISTFINIIAIIVLFLASYALAGNVYQTVFHTLVSYMIVLTMSIFFWIWWTFRNMKTKTNIKFGITLLLLILLAVGLWFLWTVVNFVMNFL